MVAVLIVLVAPSASVPTPPTDPPLTPTLKLVAVIVFVPAARLSTVLAVWLPCTVTAKVCPAAA